MDNQIKGEILSRNIKSLPPKKRVWLHMEVLCDGVKHTVSYTESGPVVCNDHTKKEVEAFRTLKELGGEPPECAQVFMELASSKNDLDTQDNLVTLNIDNHIHNIHRDIYNDRQRNTPLKPVKPLLERIRSDPNYMKIAKKRMAAKILNRSLEKQTSMKDYKIKSKPYMAVPHIAYPEYIIVREEDVVTLWNNFHTFEIAIEGRVCIMLGAKAALKGKTFKRPVTIYVVDTKKVTQPSHDTPIFLREIRVKKSQDGKPVIYTGDKRHDVHESVGALE